MTNVSLKKSAVFLTIGAMLMLNCYGCSSSFKYEKYSSENPKLDFTVEYLSGWLHSEQPGSHNSFTQVVFNGPEGEEKTFKPMMAATVRDASKVDIDPKTVEAFAEDLLSKRMKFKDCAVIRKESVKAAGEEAVSMELSYKTLDKPDALNAKPVPFKERVVILKKNGKFYILRYQNISAGFNKFNKAFSHFIGSLAIKG